MSISEQVAELEALHAALDKAFAHVHAAQARDAVEARDADLRRALMRALRYTDDTPLLSWDEVLREVMGNTDAARKVVEASVHSAVSPCRTGGNPPEPEIGMVYVNAYGMAILSAMPWTWTPDVLEVRAPWGGPVVWRRG